MLLLFRGLVNSQILFLPTTGFFFLMYGIWVSLHTSRTNLYRPSHSRCTRGGEVASSVVGKGWSKHLSLRLIPLGQPLWLSHNVIIGGEIFGCRAGITWRYPSAIPTIQTYFGRFRFIPPISPQPTTLSPRNQSM